jgi:hypothetical protein
MNIHRTALDDVKSAGRITFMKKIVPLLQRLDDCDGSDVRKVRLWQAGEKLAAPQRVGNGKSFELAQR